MWLWILPVGLLACATATLPGGVPLDGRSFTTSSKTSKRLSMLCRRDSTASASCPIVIKAPQASLAPETSFLAPLFNKAGVGGAGGGRGGRGGAGLLLLLQAAGPVGAASR
eukprot:CAMPEP_0172941918 /NCGR_PEP_ID=MMETSP1075-20121228/224785_1 /TAXON_ID=2916 /ORGANISM="Ceratium fusus, Strain PA161109" /LENGTH=110 /DNA_ID=CAMNT_0013803337 /DNA_START=1686 /DNA_END=2015 /DNA_ORIENTATION=-